MAFSDLNRRFRTIFEEGGVDYGEDAENEVEIEKRFDVALALRKNKIEKTMRRIKRAKTVDFCFLIDASNSMRGYIQGVKNGMKDVIAELTASQISAKLEKLRFAIVAYRDFEFSKPIEFIDFTEDIKTCQDFCSKIETSEKGNDVPEDVFGGLETSVGLSWNSDANTRIIFHICDAPCHGNEFHKASMRDRYSNGDPLSRTPADLFNRINSLKIDYYFGRINSTTDIMSEKFTAAYGKPIQSFGLSNIADIVEFILKSIIISVETNVIELRYKKKSYVKSNIRRDDVIPKWDFLAVQEGYYIEFIPPSSIHHVVDGASLTETIIHGVKVKLAKTPFSEGAERIAYHGLDFEHKEDKCEASVMLRHDRERGNDLQTVEIVLKEYKFSVPHMDNAQRFRTACEIQTIAIFLSREFNSVIGDSNEDHRINFLMTKIVVMTSGNRMMSWERELPRETKFIKFTNNLSYSIDQNAREMIKLGVDSKHLDIIMAFSHWTHSVTNGFLIVVDLQGCLVLSGRTTTMLLTDPAIHCKDATRYGDTNLGKNGMTAFFKIHKCNSFCRALLLRHPTAGH